MKTINEQIKKGELKSVYLLFGSEKYLVLKMKEKLKNAIISPEDSFNYSYFEGNKIDLVHIKELSETMPFFSDTRLILIEGSGLFKKSSDSMVDMLKQAPETTKFIFVESEVDKRNKLYKYVNKNGYAAELNGMTERELLVFVARMIGATGKKIRENTANYFLAVAGTDMNTLQNETEKLISYVGSREEITKKDIDAIVTVEITNKIFDMLTHIVYKRQQQALDLYYDLVAKKEPPLRILALLVRQFQILFQVKDMQSYGKSRQEMAKATGLPPFVVGKYENQTKGFSLEQLREYVRECAKIEEKIKTGQIADLIGVELLIIGFSQK
ncbi:MAG: DNA polymerase III subunit delta [Lachnospiraceae bacterium]